MKTASIACLSLLLTLTGCAVRKDNDGVQPDSGSTQQTGNVGTSDTRLASDANSGRINIILSLTAPTGAPQSLILADVQGILQKECISCHAEYGSGGLNLSGFPLSSRKTRAQILESMKSRVNDRARPMPPAGLLAIEDRIMVSSWVDAGALESFPTSTATQDFTGYKLTFRMIDDQGVGSSWQELPLLGDGKVSTTLPSMKGGAAVTFEIILKGPSGRELLNKSMAVTIPPSREVSLPIQAIAESRQVLNSDIRISSVVAEENPRVEGSAIVQLSLTLPNQGPAAPIFSDVDPIFQKQCVSCHAVDGNAGLDLSHYPLRGNRSETEILKKIKSRIENAARPMPPSGLMAASDREIVGKWIDGGARESHPFTLEEPDYTNYKVALRLIDDRGVAGNWQDLPAVVAGKSNLLLGQLQVGSDKTIELFLKGPSGRQLVNKSFKVMVAANGEIILPIQAVAEDTKAPVIEGLAIEAKNITTNQATLSWGSAHDNVTASKELKYSLYQSLPGQAFRMIEDVYAFGKKLPLADGLNTYKARLDSDGSSFALIVEDAAGKKAVYPTLSLKPAAPAAVYPNCWGEGAITSDFTKWRDAAAKDALSNPKKAARNMGECFTKEVPACLERANDFARKNDLGPSSTPDLSVEQKQLPVEFRIPAFKVEDPQYIVPVNIEQIAKNQGWLSVRYKSRHAGGFDKGSSNLLMIYVPGDKVSPPVSFDRWINISSNPDADELALEPSPLINTLNLSQQKTFTMVSLERKTDRKQAVVYFEMFTRKGSSNVFAPGSPFFKEGLKSCANCHPNGLRAISPLGFHVREGEASLPTVDWLAVKAMNDAMDTAAGKTMVSWGSVTDPNDSNKVKPLYVANAYGPMVGPVRPLNSAKSRSKEFIKSCYKSRSAVDVRDIFKRPTGMGPNNVSTLSFKSEDADFDSKIDWKKVTKAMECGSCHDGVNRGALNANTQWDQIDFKILVDQSMPVGAHSNPLDLGEDGSALATDALNSDERLALANCLKEEFLLEQKSTDKWLQEVSCEQQ